MVVKQWRLSSIPDLQPSVWRSGYSRLHSTLQRILSEMFLYLILTVLVDLGSVGRMFTYLQSILYSVILLRNHQNKVLAYSIFSRHTTNTIMTASWHVFAELLINSCLKSAIKIIKLILYFFFFQSKYFVLHIHLIWYLILWLFAKKYILLLLLLITSSLCLL